MRKFLLPLLLATTFFVGYVATGHVPTYPLDQLATAMAGIWAIASVPLYIIGHKLDIVAAQHRSKRRLEKAAVREMENQARERQARADAEELRAEHYRHGDFDYSGDKPNGAARPVFGFHGFGG